jgi:hypothetical protein
MVFHEEKGTRAVSHLKEDVWLSFAIRRLIHVLQFSWNCWNECERQGVELPAGPANSSGTIDIPSSSAIGV